MSRMPLLSVVLYISTRLTIEGEGAAASMLDLFARVGIHCATRDGAADDGVLDDGTVH